MEDDWSDDTEDDSSDDMEDDWLEPESAAEVLEERRELLRMRKLVVERCRERARQVELAKAVLKFWAARGRARGKRRRSVASGKFAEAFLQFVHECRDLKAEARLDQIIQPNGSIEAEKVARNLYRLAAAGDRTALVAEIDALSSRDQDFRGDVWHLVGWLTENICPEKLVFQVLRSERERARLSQGSPAGSHEGIAPTSAAPPRGDRLALDDASRCITLDGIPYAGLDPVAYQIFKEIHAGNDTPVSSGTLNNRPGRRRKKLSRELDKLPPPLRAVVEGQGGRGYSIRLPPTFP
jgi:hypothetical protein